MEDGPAPEGRESKYRRIVRHFEQAIDCGDLMPGQKVPPVPRIAETFDVAGETAARAVRELRDNGYVHTTAHGTFVLDRMRVGVEVLPYLHPTGCRSTIHCANFGFCHRCSPELARASSFALLALKEEARASSGEQR